METAEDPSGEFRSNTQATIKPILIYIPGLDGSGRFVEAQETLYEHYQVEAIRYPDHPEQTYESLSDQVIEVIDRVSNGRKVTLLAESFGGAVAMTTALKAPQKIKQLFLLNTFAYYRKRWQIFPAGTFGPSLPSRPLPKWTRRLRQGKMLEKGLSTDVTNRFWGYVEAIPMSALGYRMRLIRDLDLRPQLREIDVPTTVIVAGQDRLIPNHWGEELAASIPDAKLKRIEGAHIALVSVQTDFAEVLLAADENHR